MSTEAGKSKSLFGWPQSGGLWLMATASWPLPLVWLVLLILIGMTPALAEKTNPDFVPPEITLPYPSYAGQGQAAPSGQTAPGQPVPGKAGGATPGFLGFQVPSSMGGAPGTTSANGINPFLMKASDRLRMPPGSQFASKGMSAPGTAPGVSAQAAPGNGPPQNSPPATLSTQVRMANSDPLAVIATSKGNITIRLFRQYAPQTVAAFMQMVKEGFYNGLTFHRLVPGFVLQGGSPKGDPNGNYVPPGSRLPRFLPLETSPNLRHNAAGVVAMAHQPGNVNSSSCQFYITLSQQKSLDGQYTIFGGVTDGMDVVNRMTVGDKIISITVSE